MNSPHVNRLLLAKGLRAFGDGYVSLLLPVYLLELGYSALQVGIIATAYGWQATGSTMTQATSSEICGTTVG